MTSQRELKKHHRDYLRHLSESEDAKLAKLHNMVSDSIVEENLLTESLFSTSSEKATFGERVSDRIAAFGGSWRFIIGFLLMMSFWIGLNTWQKGSEVFDPYPFILLNLVLSCVAALQAPIIMMSQNRKEERDRRRGESDYLVNLKAEIEIRTLHQKIDLMTLDQLKTLLTIQKEQLELLNEIKGRTVGR